MFRFTRLSALLTLSGLSACSSISAEEEQSKVDAWPAFPSAVPLVDSGEPDPYAKENPEQRNARMAWWRHAKFGMFIHWGVYSVPAGMHKGEKVRGYAEWLMRKGRIPIADYRAYAKDFNPTQYDPDFWAQLARDAGMRYMVITAKHHDGFAVFPSDVTDWDITDSTPYGKDLIAPLAEAARKKDLKFGLYYSQAQDWTHPGGSTGRGSDSKPWDETHAGNMDTYIKTIAVPQVKEILTRYQPDVLWWDTPAQMNEPRARELVSALRLAPGIIHNNRLGGGYKGDIETPEQFIPATGFKDRDWEVCMTMNDSWGFQSYDHNWKSTDDIIRMLCDIVSKGGNFLLNVGPTKEGIMPQASIDRLREVGAWMDVNGESIHGTSANPFSNLAWGRCTRKVHPDGTTLYFHVFEWPKDGKLRINGLKSLPASAQLLASGETLKFSAFSEGASNGVIIEVPDQAPGGLVPVIKVNISGALEVADVQPDQAKEQ
jgi:alpha-L-fucosidase